MLAQLQLAQTKIKTYKDKYTEVKSTCAQLRQEHDIKDQALQSMQEENKELERKLGDMEAVKDQSFDSEGSFRAEVADMNLEGPPDTEEISKLQS
jgi:hypothetical protein